MEFEEFKGGSYSIEILLDCIIAYASKRSNLRVS